MKLPDTARFKLPRISTTVFTLCIVACCIAIGAISIAFRQSLTNINEQPDKDAIVFLASYAHTSDVAAYTEDEMKKAFMERYETNIPTDYTVDTLSRRLGMQPLDPGVLSDLVLVGTVTQEHIYSYKTFVTTIKIDTVIRNLKTGTRSPIKDWEYTIPELPLSAGDEIHVYDEFKYVPGETPSITVSAERSPYLFFLTPLRAQQQYLLFLTYLPREGDTQDLSKARFQLAPSIYSRIPLSEPHLYSAHLPVVEERDITKLSRREEAATPPSDEQNAADEQARKERSKAYQEAYQALPPMSLSEAQSYDILVSDDSAAETYRELVSKLREMYQV